MVRFMKLHFNAKLLVANIAPVGLAFLSLVCSTAHTAEIHQFFTGARQLGMGGAYVAVVNDETSLLTNPAGLGKIRDVTVTVIDVELQGSTNDTAIATLSNIKNVGNPQGLLDTLNKSAGKHWHLKAQSFPSITGPNFGVGILAKYSSDAEVSSDASNFRLEYTNDWAATMGYCFRFFGGIMKLGFAGRLVNRSEVAQDISPATTNLSLGALASEGVGAAADGGLILTAPIVGLPTLAATVRDIGHTYYDLREGIFNGTVNRPTMTPQSIDVALAIFPILSNSSRATLTAEVHDVTNLSQETNINRRIHVGGELNMGDLFFVRAGLNQSFWTGGMEIATEKVQIQIASYGEDIGTSAAAREDRRWVSKFTFRF
jgi:hypothetical protein